MPYPHEIIDEVLNGSTSYSKEEVRQAALDVWESQPLHQCYWNNRFFLAIKFDLPEEMQRQAAWMSVLNGLNGYWEWKTHSSYDLVQALQDIGITDMVPKSLDDVPDHLYIDVDAVVLEQIAHKFKLPTMRFGGNHTVDWTEEERSFRDLVDSMISPFWYPVVQL